MASYVGVDWAGSCWIVVKTGEATTVTTEPAFLNVWHEHGRDDEVHSILVDIPIGLSGSGSRECDEKASQMLSNRQSTVFPIPSRTVVESDEYIVARKENGGSLGSQSWWLFPRIREVDVFLQENHDAKHKIYESHPEVCFAKLTGSPLPPKNTEVGQRERLEVFREDPEFQQEIENVVLERQDGTDWHDRISQGKIDDVIDAAVLAFSAKHLGLTDREEGREYPRIPDDPEDDPKLEHPMEIVYYEP